MSVTVSSGQVQLANASALPASIPQPATGTQTHVSIEDSNEAWTQNVQRELYTVTAGKTFYVYGFAVSGISGTSWAMLLQNATPTTKAGLTFPATATTYPCGDVICGGSCPIASFAAGTKVCGVCSMTADNTNKINFLVWGIEI